MSSAGSRVERLITLYFNQLLRGCGNPACLNPDCASSSRFSHSQLTPNQAAILAVQLTSRQAQLCYASDSSFGVSTFETLDTQQRYGMEQTDDESELPNTISGSNSGADSVVSSSNALRSLSSVIAEEEASRNSVLAPSEFTRLLMLLFNVPDNEDSVITRSRDERVPRCLDENRPSVSSPNDRCRHRDIPASSVVASTEDPTSSSSFVDAATLDPTSDGLKSFRASANSTSALASLVSSLHTSQERELRTSGLTLDELKRSIDVGEEQGDWSHLIGVLSAVFSSYEALSVSFLSDLSGTHESLIAITLPKRPKQNEQEPMDSQSLESTVPMGDMHPFCQQKNNLTSNEGGDADPSPDDTPMRCVPLVNIHAVRSAWSLIATLPERQNVVDALMRAVRRLVVNSLYQILVSQVPDGLSDTDASATVRETQQRLINLFLILYECPFAKDPLHFEHLLLNINRAVSWLPIMLQSRLCRAWANTVHLPLANCSDKPQPEQTNLWSLQRILLHHITLRCLTTDYGVPNEDKQICEAALVLRIVYYASILAGEMDDKQLLHREAMENQEFDDLMLIHSTTSHRSSRSRTGPVEDPLAKALCISFQDCRKPFIPAKDFVNDTLNEALKPKRDFINYRSNDAFGEFSFMRLPFLLQTKLKSDLLHYDTRLRMIDEQRGAFVMSLFGANQELPFLKIHVSRERVIEDTLLALEIVCLEKPGDLKKQLLIEFEGEQGVDEGGLSKEFFQLIIEKIFDPVYGMFVSDDEFNTYWFNPEPLEDLDREYCLIGILLGLAIYNDVILDVRFPAVLYRKLAGKLGAYADLKDARPDLVPGLQALLDYDGDDFEETFGCTFEITYQDLFGNVLRHELLTNGVSIPVTKANRTEFVDRYADFLLNTSVKKQFTAFRRGFQMVVDESPLTFLFRPDEIELLVCGSRDYDFKELERVTKYDGYTADSPVIKNFWHVVHNMTTEQRYQLLQFVTGSDRIPAGGMSHMKFTIARQGADTDRLPTAHTCFNILLLPDYSTLEQMQRMLPLAMAFCKGFGMS